MNLLFACANNRFVDINALQDFRYALMRSIFRFADRYALRGKKGFISYRMSKTYFDFAEQKYRVAKQHMDNEVTKMDADVVRIYEKLCNKYSLELTSAHKQGFHSSIDFLILIGISVLGKFEMYYDDVPSFAFYATRSSGEVFAHWHLQTATEAEKAVADFMEGKLTLISFGQPYDI